MSIQENGRRGSSRIARLMGGASLIGVMTLVATAAYAQGAGSSQVEEIVVTGTSIRGVAPVGSSVVAVGQQQIEQSGAQTVQQILRSVPAVVGMGSVGQGSFGSASQSGTNAPTIHGLGASASNSTLILIDGHRFPLSGTNHALADPNIIPPLAIERVEVLAEGASSVYGSDAVAGVINFITRRRYDGVQSRAQYAFADGYKAYSAGLLAGKTWESGSVMAVYGFSDRDPLQNYKREFTARDRRATGGSNLASFFCAPATLQVGSGPIFTAPYTGAGLANSAANAPCDTTGYADLIPQETRHSVMFKAQQDITEALSISGDMVYSNRRNLARTSRGTSQATIFGPGSTSTAQINPFFRAPAGSTATSVSVRFDADELLGPGAVNKSGEEAGYSSAALEYRMAGDWRATLSGVAGFTNSFTDNTGQLCTSCALLALNGTTNGGGSLTAVSVPGTTQIVTNLPLTAANALDVFNTGSANRTSASVRQQLVDTRTAQDTRQTLENAKLQFEGPVAELPGGQLRAAFGGEIIRYNMTQKVVRPLGTGPSSTGSRQTLLNYERDVKSAFAEFLVPLVSPEMNVPLVRRLAANVSGRYDDYSDFGSTSNPRIGGDWELIEGLTVRGNFAKSFVAPALTSRGADARGTTAETSVALFGGTLNVPVSAYPNVVGLPGCAPGAATCTIGGSVPGLQLNGGNASVQPQKGESWSLGLDFRPVAIPGLRLNATYWSNQINGAITAPQAAFAVNAAGLNNLLTIYPGGASQAQIAEMTAGRPLNASIPATVYFSYNFQQRNALNLWVEGVDLQASYDFDTSAGRFGVEAIASRKTRFDQQVGTGGAIFSVLNTTGFNTTFPSIKLDARAGVTWTSNFGLSANAYWNHTSSYRNWSGNTVTPIVRTGGVPTGGGDKVKAGNFVELHLSYEFQGEGYTRDLQLFMDINNIFDTKPPFYNSANGYDTFSGNPLGRLIAVGVRKRW
jgi:iron complex outermembrane receptor protein